MNIENISKKILHWYDNNKRYLPWRKKVSKKQKEYFTLKRKKVLVYMQKVYYPKKPNSTYLHTIIEGYKDCNLDIRTLKKNISKYNIDYKITW